jgi:carbonic anhydrase
LQDRYFDKSIAPHHNNSKELAMKKIAILLALAGVLMMVSPLAQPLFADGPVHWTYEGEEGPEHWGDLSQDYELCKIGQEQSPVNIPADAPVNPGDITFNYQPSALNIWNNGHTIQANYDAGSTMTVAGKTYKLAQFHFHIPSEHELDGNLTAMELHLVHKADDGELAVVV